MSRTPPASAGLAPHISQLKASDKLPLRFLAEQINQSSRFNLVNQRLPSVQHQRLSWHSMHPQSVPEFRQYFQPTRESRREW